MRLPTLLCLLSLSFLCTAQAWEPGKESTWLGLGEDTPLKLYVPEDYDAKKAWPLIYVFHGTGGRASTSLFQRYTGGRGFVLVGAPYAIPGANSLSRSGVHAEIRRIGKVRRLLLEQSLSLDKRTYVGGFSKGGWMSDLLATEGFETLTGVFIMGAGRIPDDVGRVLAREKTAPLHPLAIYIGIGQLDSNHLYSRRADLHYRQAKHRVTFEEYLTKGHRSGESDTPYLNQWLREQIATKQDLESEATQWWTASLAQAETITPPIERLLFLEHMSKAPYARHVAEDKRASLAKTLNIVRRHRSLQSEMDSRRAYEKAQQEEEQFRKSSEIPKIADTFKRIHTRAPKTYFGQRAALDLVRLKENYRVLKRSRQSSGSTDAFPMLPSGTDALTARFARFDKLLRQQTPIKED